MVTGPGLWQVGGGSCGHAGQGGALAPPPLHTAAGSLQKNEQSQ